MPNYVYQTPPRRTAHTEPRSTSRILPSRRLTQTSVEWRRSPGPHSISPVGGRPQITNGQQKYDDMSSQPWSGENLEKKNNASSMTIDGSSIYDASYRILEI